MAQRDGSAHASAQPDSATGWQRLLGLREHSLVRFSAAYVVAAWVIVQVAATVGPAFDLPNWFLRAVILLAVLGFLLTIGIVALRQRDRSAPASSRRRGIVLALGIGGLVAGVAALGLLARETVLGEEQVTIAVLPFADLSPGRDKAFFAEGVAEEILSALASDKAIKVLGRTSARQLERNPDPAEVRSRLGVTHMVEGSARTAGEALRVNVRLVDTSNGERLWEERYDGQMADVFKVQDEIARTVVKRLRGTFETGPASQRAPAAVDAYQAYLEARALMREPKKEPLTRARKLALAIVRDHPNYALGHALLADATILLSDGPFAYGDIPADKARRIALAHGRQAVRLAPDRAEGYAALGLALPPREALAPLRKAITLDRSFALLRNRLGIALNQLQRNDEAFEQYRLGAETDPLSSAAINRYVAALAASGKGKEAMRAADLFVLRGGSEAQGWRFRGNALGLMGDVSGAIAARRRALALDPALPYQHEWLAVSLNLLGLDAEAERYTAPLSRYFQLFVADDRGALKARFVADGAIAWSANGMEIAVFSLARARDWATIARFYDLRPSERRDLCATLPSPAPFIAMALARVGRSREGAAILDCFQRQLKSRLAARYRSPDDVAGELEMWQASLLALRGDRGAFDWLGKAVDRGWVGQYVSASLADWPQFDGLRGDPRYAALQRRIDARIGTERKEVARILGDAAGRN